MNLANTAPLHRAITDLIRKEVAAEVQRALRGLKAPAGRAASHGIRIRRSPEQVEAVGAKVLAYIKKHPGSRLEEIGRGMGVETGGLKLPILSLRDQGQLRTEGQKRGTMYFAEKGGAGEEEIGARHAGLGPPIDHDMAMSDSAQDEWHSRSRREQGL